MLGGPERHTLFVLTAASGREADAWAEGKGRIESVPVEAPGAGLP
jgi:sugar lactone lactonase YvrE